MKRILLVNQHVVPIFIDVANVLQKDNVETTLFSGYIEKGGRALSSKIKLVNSIGYNRNNTFSRAWTWSIFALHYLLFSFLNSRYDKVVVATNPPFALLITYLVARFKKNPYYIILYDLYPDALVQTKIVGETSFIVRMWSKINHKVFKGAASIITLSHSMKEAALKYGAARFTVIPNWADTTYLKPIDRSENRFVTQYQLSDKKVVLYSGNMGLTHDLESLVGAAELLQNESDLVFVFIGEGGKKESLIKSVRDKKLNNILFLPYQDGDNFPLAMASADIGVVTLGKGAEGISVPSKTYSNLAVGLCLLVIAPPDSEVAQLVKQHDVGVLCEPGKPSELASMLQALINDKEKLLRLKGNSRKASAYFDVQNAHLYDQVINGATR